MKNRTEINKYILQQVRAGKMDKEISLSILKEINTPRINNQFDVAIIGMACRLPFADNTEEFWGNLIKGIDNITLRPKIRMKKNKLDPTMKGGYMQDIFGFDASFFRIPPREAILMHPLQRLFLETAWEAIEDSGNANKSFFGSKTGVFAGIDTTCPYDYRDGDVFDEIFVMTGEMKSLMASRLSYIYDLKGPSFIIDSACSSGLVCIHLAIDSLKRNECSVALAGGINLITNEFVNMGEVEASNWKLAAFDKHSSGTVWGDGVALLVLKPLDQAIKDRDNIHAVIKGSAINNDGKTSGITAPSAITQSEVIIKAWENAEIDPATISYIEGHATGTVIGDPIEINGLKMAFEKYTNKKQFCGIGTVKPNIGHGVGIAGISSLIKVVLAMEKAQIPPNINFREPNPFINFCNSPVYVNDTLKKWDTGDVPKRAGINSFGFNRTNCHIVLEEMIKSYNKKEKRNVPSVFTLSAKDPDALKNYINKYIASEYYISRYNIEDICFTINMGREHYNHRLAVICKNTAELFVILKKIQDKDSALSTLGTNVFYNKYMVSNIKTGQQVEGEITLLEKKDLGKEAQSLLLQFIKNNSEDVLKKICELYINGAEIEWGELYNNIDTCKVSLPTYPFNRKIFRKKEKEVTAIIENSRKTISHPMLKTLLADTFNISVYLTEISVDTHWVLTDHIIMGFHFLPGTGFIEIALACASHYFKTGSIELCDVIFIQPLIIRKDEVKEIHTIIEITNKETLFKIVSKKDNFDDDETGWVIHARGKMKKGDLDAGIQINTDNLKQEYGANPIAIDMNRKMGQFQFGPRWHNMTEYYMTGDTIYSAISMNKACTEDAGQYYLHPAMFDNAINMAVQLTVRAEDEEIFLPFSFKSIKVNARMPENFVSFQKVLNGLSNKNETIVSDITLIDKNDHVFAEIAKYSLKKINTKIIKQSISSFNKNIFYSINWKSKELEISQLDSIKDVLFITTNNPVSKELISAAKDKCKHVFEIHLGDKYSKIDDNIITISDMRKELQIALLSLEKTNISHIFYTPGIISDNKIDSISELGDVKTKSILGLLHLAKNLLQVNSIKKSEIIILADFSHEVTARESLIHPTNASLCALAKVIKKEYTNTKIKFIDTDDQTGADILINESFSDNGDFLVAYRNGKRYIPELTDVNIDDIKTTDLSLSSEGVYIIAGGSGGIGLEISKYLTSKENINIAFINRTPLPSEKEWDIIVLKNENHKVIDRIKAINIMENSGSHIVCLQGDVSDYTIMKEHIDTLRKKFTKINGIINCAGVPGEGFVINKDSDQFNKVLLPKIDGSWILDSLTKNDNLEFFIMCSSILSLTGTAGQSDYAAANAYMDALAVKRRKEGKKALAINWPPWKEVGMAKGISSKMWGVFNPITTQNAMNVFDLLFNREIYNSIVCELNYSHITSIENDLNLNVSNELKTKIRKKAAKYKDSSTQDNKEKSSVKAYAGGNQTIQEIQDKIGMVFASILGLETMNLSESFINLGGDSIIAANLLKEVDELYPGVVDLSDIFTYPTIKQMSAYIKKKISIREQPVVKEKDTKKYDSEVQRIMEGLSKGEISADEADELISKLNTIIEE